MQPIKGGHEEGNMQQLLRVQKTDFRVSSRTTGPESYSRSHFHALDGGD